MWNKNATMMKRTTTMDQKTAPTMSVPSAMALRIVICLNGIEMFSQIQSTALFETVHSTAYVRY